MQHARVHRSAWARERFGALADQLFAALDRADPLADALVATLAGRFDAGAALREREAGALVDPHVAALIDDAAQVPAWVDWDAIERARGLFERTGIAGGFVLSLRSLMAGYIAPAGNKPLAFSGRLREQAPRRVAETARFVTAVAAPGGMRVGAEGWSITVQVRLMHAQVRRLLLASGRWDHAAWAEPINQHDMLATVLLFSEVYVEGLRKLGFRVRAREAEDWLHLWCWVGRVMGCEDALLPRSYAQAQAQRELIQHTQGPPDDDARALAAALLATPPGHAPPWVHRLAGVRLGFASALSRHLMGPVMAEGLGIAASPAWTAAIARVPPLVDLLEQARERLPGVDDELRGLGRRYWAFVVEAALRGTPAEFARPARLA